MYGLIGEDFKIFTDIFNFTLLPLHVFNFSGMKRHEDAPCALRFSSNDSDKASLLKRSQQ